MAALLAIVRTAGEAAEAIEAGADQVAVAGDPLFPDGRRPFVRCGPMLAGPHPDLLRAVREAVAAGCDRIWLPLDPDAGPALAEAVGRGLATIAIVPLGRRLASDICDEAAACGLSALLVADAPFGRQRLLDAHSVVALAGFVGLCRARGLAVGFAGGIEPPDVPRLLALEPASIGLDRLLRDGGDRFAPDRLRAARLLWDGAQPDAAAPQPTRLDRIFIRDRIVAMSVGAYAREKEAPQRVRFSVEAEILPGAPSAAGMAGVVSYDLITDAIDRLASAHVDLVETLAEKIAAAVLAHPRVAAVVVTVEKLDLGSGSVGCSIARNRSS